MMPNQKADPIGEVAAAIVADDPQIRARMQKLVNALIDDAFHILKYGTPIERAGLMKQVVPALLRSMRGADANASERQELDAYERMMAMMRDDDVGAA
jgi:hypothetical protein